MQNRKNENNIYKMKSALKFNILQHFKFLGFTNLQYFNIYEIYVNVYIWADGKVQEHGPDEIKLA